MSSNPPRSSQPQLPPLEVPSDLEVEYVNLVRIAHSPSELVFDFAHLLPGGAPAQVRSRIVMSPLGAKLFYRALAENLAKYEASFGEISVPGASSLADYLFRSQNPGGQPPPKKPPSGGTPPSPGPSGGSPPEDSPPEQPPQK